MRNIDRIRRMSLEELAPLLVYSKKIYDWEDELEVNMSPSGSQCYSYEDTIDDCIRWLDSEQSISLEISLKKIDERFGGLTTEELEKVVLESEGK